MPVHADMLFMRMECVDDYGDAIVSSLKHVCSYQWSFFLQATITVSRNVISIQRDFTAFDDSPSPFLHSLVESPCKSLLIICELLEFCMYERINPRIVVFRKGARENTLALYFHWNILLGNYILRSLLSFVVRCNLHKKNIILQLRRNYFHI